MKIEDCRQAYYDSSEKASNIARQLAFAGLALIWAFRVTAGERPVIPTSLRWAGILLVTGLALDFFHYVVKTIIWGTYHRYKEQQVSETAEFLAPSWINYPGNLCFVLKLGAIGIAYLLLITSMFDAFWN